MKKLLFIFLISFFLNLAWENFHSLLYASYKGAEITQFILWRATLGDAIMITAFAIPFVFTRFFRAHLWLVIVLGFAIAIAIELLALSAGRWAYNDLMPIVPFLKVGLTPTIQLGLLGYMTYKIVLKHSG